MAHSRFLAAVVFLVVVVFLGAVVFLVVVLFLGAVVFLVVVLFLVVVVVPDNDESRANNSALRPDVDKPAFLKAVFS